MYRRISALVAVAALTACVEGTTAPVQSRGPTVSYDFTNGPSSPNSMIIRSSGGDFFLIFNDDASDDLVAIMRTPMAPASPVPCEGTQELDAAALQLVFHRSGAVNMLLKGTDVHVWLYEREAFLSQPDLCTALATQTPLYEGFGNFVLHDNDAFGSGVHTDAFGFSARGTVTGIDDGPTFRFTDEYHGSVGADGTLHHFSSNITLSKGK
jgi:hypothetical protein